MSIEKDIKEMFTEEFDAADICVSEELIAKTMTAIRNLSGDSSDKNIESTENTESTDSIKSIENTESTESTENTSSDKVQSVMELKSSVETSGAVTSKSRSARRSSAIKWISGIAAALFIGVVGFAIYRLGVGEFRKDESTAANNRSEAADIDMYKAEAMPNSVEPELTLDEPTSSAMSSSASSAQAGYDAEGAGTPADSIKDDDKSERYADETAIDPNPTYSYPSYESDGLDNSEKNYKITESLAGINGKLNLGYTNIEELIKATAVEIQGSLDDEARGSRDKKDEEIRANEGYKAIIDGGSGLEDIICGLLSESTGNEDVEYIYALMLQDLTGESFTGADSERTWNTGKEYLELYEALSS